MRPSEVAQSSGLAGLAADCWIAHDAGVCREDASVYSPFQRGSLGRPSDPLAFVRMQKSVTNYMAGRRVSRCQREEASR